jgi:hypothetical protein
VSETHEKHSKLKAAFVLAAAMTGVGTIPDVQAGHHRTPTSHHASKKSKFSHHAAKPHDSAANPTETKDLLNKMGMTIDTGNANKLDDNTRQAIAEYRFLVGSKDTGKGLSAHESQQIRELVKISEFDAKANHIPVSAAAALHIAAVKTGVDYNTIHQHYKGHDGNISNTVKNELPEHTLFKFNTPTWLYMVKQYGGTLGLNYFADKIDLTAKNIAKPPADNSLIGTVPDSSFISKALAQLQPHTTPPATATDAGYSETSVKDPAILRAVMGLRDNPRINAIMGAEYIKNKAVIPALGYEGASSQQDPVVAKRQDALMTLGYDLGIKGADGIRGPLTDASEKEYKKIAFPTGTKEAVTAAELDQHLSVDVAKATSDAARLSRPEAIVTPALAFSVRTSAERTGVPFGYMMQLSKIESALDPNAQCATSTATGYFQHTDDTWFTGLKLHGAKYGVQEIADQIQDNDIKNPYLRQYVRDLRKNDLPLYAMINAELQAENKANIASTAGAKPAAAAMYAAHFFGAPQANAFINVNNTNPSAKAADAFPQAAKSNQPLFANKTVSALYDRFTSMFSSSFYDDKSTAKEHPEKKHKATHTKDKHKHPERH